MRANTKLAYNHRGCSTNWTVRVKGRHFDGIICCQRINLPNANVSQRHLCLYYEMEQKILKIYLDEFRAMVELLLFC